MKNKECFRVQKISKEEFLKNCEFLKMPERKNKIWLVKDGSVDTEKLDLLGINYIVYRDTKPTIIEY